MHVKMNSDDTREFKFKLCIYLSQFLIAVKLVLSRFEAHGSSYVLKLDHVCSPGI